MSGIILKKIGYNYCGVAWEGELLKVTRLGFIHRNRSTTGWSPVVQAHGELLPLEKVISLSNAARQIVMYHHGVGNIDASLFTLGSMSISYRLH